MKKIRTESRKNIMDLKRELNISRRQDLHSYNLDRINRDIEIIKKLTIC